MEVTHCWTRTWRNYRRYMLLAGVAMLLLLSTSGPRDGRPVEASRASYLSPSRLETKTFFSAALGKPMMYNVYLPPGYDSNPDLEYPVLYMLHWLGGTYQAWSEYGLYSLATQVVLNGAGTPMIIVTPEGGRNYWLNHANNGPRYGAYVSQDLVKEIDRQFRTIAESDARAIGGISMGGHGAINIAMNWPDIFSVVGAHSLALRRYDEAFSFFGDAAYFRQHDPPSLFAEYPVRARRLTLWLDTGASDPWFSRVETMHQQLLASGISHEWRVWSGGHDPAYWMAHIVEYLRFYSKNLLQARVIEP